MKTPYHALPSYTRWSKAVAGVDYQHLDPVAHFPWRIAKEDRVATAGSCFAQHIARHLKNNGFNYYVVEDGHPVGTPEEKAAFNYGTFSARYGNIYTAKQLVQLFKRAYGTFLPLEKAWQNESGAIVDPFRPNIQPQGFYTVEEMQADRESHLSNVRKLFETSNIFVFTLGLTEAWRSKADGAVFPVCPGVAGGVFDPENYEFVNFGIHEIIADVEEFLALAATVNPSLKVILTVSPVPLIATAEDQHVLVSTTYSKSALRTACEEIIKKHQHIAYFPSYEIITGAYNRGRYFAEDLRSVTEEGVQHVMGLFLKHVAEMGADNNSVTVNSPSEPADNFIKNMMHVVETTCEEDLIEASMKGR